MFSSKIKTAIFLLLLIIVAVQSAILPRGLSKRSIASESCVNNDDCVFGTCRSGICNLARMKREAFVQTPCFLMPDCWDYHQVCPFDLFCFHVPIGKK
ncbi:unnamed protein product [Caenorhabditis nigoni]